MGLAGGQPNGFGEILRGEGSVPGAKVQFASILVRLPEFGALADGFRQ
jgi:hypothetical protein